MPYAMQKARKVWVEQQSEIIFMLYSESIPALNWSTYCTLVRSEHEQPKTKLCKENCFSKSPPPAALLRSDTSPMLRVECVQDFDGAWWAFIPKVVADQTVWSIFLNAAYSTMIMSLQGKSPPQVSARIDW